MNTLKKNISILLLYILLLNNILANAAYIVAGTNIQTDGSYVDGISLTGSNTGATISGTGQISSTGGIYMEGDNLSLNIDGGTLELMGSGIYMSGTNNVINITGTAAQPSNLKVDSSISDKIGIVNLNLGKFYLKQSMTPMGFEKLSLNSGEFYYQNHSLNINQIESMTGSYNKIIVDNAGNLNINNPTGSGNIDIFISGYSFSGGMIQNEGARSASLYLSPNSYSINSFGAQFKTNSGNLIESGSVINTINTKIQLVGYTNGFSGTSMYVFDFCKTDTTTRNCIQDGSGNDMIFTSTGIYNGQNELFINLPNDYNGSVKLKFGEIISDVNTNVKIKIPLSKEIHFNVNIPGGSENHCTATSQIGDNCSGGKVYYKTGSLIYIADQIDGSGLLYYGDNILYGANSSNNGLSNTNILSGAIGSAGKSCYDFTLNGFNDWYLPSKDELNMLYSNKSFFGNFGNGKYWSSTETSSTGAVAIWFSSGTISPTEPKSTNTNYRCVRKFDINGSTLPQNYFKINQRSDSKDKHFYLTGETMSVSYNGTQSGETIKVYLSGITNPSFLQQVGTGIANGNSGSIELSGYETFSLGKYLIKMQKISLAGVESTLIGYLTNPFDYEKDTTINFASIGEVKTVTGSLIYSGNILTSLNNGIAFVNGPTGLKEITINNGQFSFTGLLNNRYSIQLDNPIKYKSGTLTYPTNYVPELSNYTVDINGDKYITINVRNKNSSTDFISLTGTINGLNGQEVIFWGSTNNTYYEERLGVLSSNAHIFNIQAPKNLGFTKVGIKKPAGNTGLWLEPKPFEIDIKDVNIGGINFSPETNLKTLNITVKENNGNILSGAYVKVYSPSGENIGVSKESNSLGIASFHLPKGSYTYYANFKGLQPSIAKTLTIGDTSSYTGALTLYKPNIEISGKVYHNGELTKDVSMYAYNNDNNKFLHTQTDSLGEYKFFVGEGNWNIGGSHLSYGNLSELVLTNLTGSLTNQSFVFEELETITGSVRLTSGTGVSGVNIQAHSLSGNYNTFTDIDGNYILKLKSGDYTLKAFSSIYGNIGQSNVTISTSPNTPVDFTINTPKNITVSFTGAGLGNLDDITKFNWMFDIFDQTSKIGFSKNITGYTGYTFENIPSGHTYKININLYGIGNVYNTGITLNTNKNIEINIPEQEKIIYLTGIVYQTGTTTPLNEALIEFRNTQNKQIIGVKTNESGLFTLKTSLGTSYEIFGKKIGYENGNIFTGTISTATHSLPVVYLSPIGSTITLTGTITNTGVADSKIFFSLKGINTDGTDNSNYFSKEGTLSGNTFTFDGIPSNFGSGKVIIGVNGYELYKTSVRKFQNSNLSAGSITLTPIELAKPVVTPITTSLGGVIEDESIGIKVTLPNNALGNTLDTVSITVSETTRIPSISGSEPINGTAKEITSLDSNGSAITDLSSNATIELSYSGSDLVNAKSGITLKEVQNLQISYFDPTTLSWISLPTILTSSSENLFNNYSGTTLLSAVSGYENLVFTLKATTDHFTLFTALISSTVNNAKATTTSSSTSTTTTTGGGGSGNTTTSVDLVSAILQTKDKLTTYLGNTTQSIKMIAGKNINDVLYIERNGKKIYLKDILADASKSITNLSSNIVAFGVGDIIASSKEGSLSISIDGYTRIDLNANAKFKIAEAGKNFLTYDNLGGKVKYDFDHRDDKDFTYKVKGKTSYATIRGTTLEVESSGTKDTYNLIQGKIDVYNATLKKTVSMVAGDTYVVYADGKEDNSGIKSMTTKTSTASTIPTKIETPVVVDKTMIGKNDELGTKVTFMYNDVSNKEWYFKYVNSLNSHGIIANNDKFYPDSNISRMELLKMVSLASGINATYDAKYTFSDVSDKNYWGTKYVCSAKKLGYISATNTNFRPSDNITRAEALKMIMSFKKSVIAFDSQYTYQDIKENDWWTKYISTASKKGYIDTTNKFFSPESFITRKEVAKMVYNVFYK